jgi:hypothetical protein
MFDPPVGKIPEPIFREFNAIRLDVCDLYSMWRMYAELFGNKDYAAVIDEWAPAPFLLIHHSMRSAIVLSLGRLLDPATTKRKGKDLQNLSFAHLVEVVKAHSDLAFHSKLSEMLKDAETDYSPLGTWRDKRFGHADRDHTPPLGAEQLPDVSEIHIEEAVLKLKRILNEIHCYFNGPDVEFPFPVLEDCAGQLMRLVEDGVRFRRAEVDTMFE